MKDARKKVHKKVQKTYHSDGILHRMFPIFADGVEKMLIAGILGSESKLQTANIISSMLTSTGEKVSVIEPAGMPGMDSKRVKAYINELEKNNVDVLILKMDITETERYMPDDIRFDILVYTDRSDQTESDDRCKYSESMEKVFSLLADKGTAIVNVDDGELIRILNGRRHKFITYGFNTKASVTTSSIGDTVFKDSFLCCLQRPVSTRGGNIIEPQEYKLSLDAGEFDSHSLLAAASFAIVNGIDLNHLELQ